MSTLTDTASFSRKASVWVIVGIVAIIVLLIFLGIGKRIKSAFFPAPPLPPTVAFGKLPKVDLSEGIKPQAGIVYSLQTITGEFPTIAGEAKVFSVREAEPSFGTLDKVKSNLSNERFETEPVELAGGLLKFSDSSAAKRTITVDVTKRNFFLESEYFSDLGTLESRPRSLEEALNRANGFLSALDVDTVDFPDEKIGTKFMRIDGSVLSEASSLSGANLIQVIYNREDLDEVPVIWPQNSEPRFYALVSQEDVVEAKIESMPIQKFKFATYPLRGPAAAFEDLRNGQAAFVKPQTTSQVSIIDVTLGYVESAKNDEYLQPMYFFRGANNFIAYVPAVADAWIK